MLDEGQFYENISYFFTFVLGDTTPAVAATASVVLVLPILAPLTAVPATVVTELVVLAH